MPNIAKLYSEACGKVQTEDISQDGVVKANDLTTSPSIDATRVQLKHTWLQSTVTQDFVKSLKEEIDNLETTARQMAVGYPSNQNHLEIINRLVKADTLRKVIEKYASN